MKISILKTGRCTDIVVTVQYLEELWTAESGFRYVPKQEKDTEFSAVALSVNAGAPLKKIKSDSKLFLTYTKLSRVYVVYVKALGLAKQNICLHLCKLQKIWTKQNSTFTEVRNINKSKTNKQTKHTKKNNSNSTTTSEL